MDEKALNLPEDPKKICELKKSVWKKLVNLQKIIEKEVMEKVKGMTKTKAFKLIEDTREILKKGWVRWTKEEENEEEAAMY